MKKLLIVFIILLISSVFAGETPVKEELSQQEISKLRDDMQELIAKINEQKIKLQSLTIDSSVPYELNTQDIKDAEKVLRENMTTSLINFYKSLNNIITEINTSFGKLKALKIYADNETGVTGPMTGEYEKELKNKIPKLNAKINAIYTAALDNLFTINNTTYVYFKTWKGTILSQNKFVLKDQSVKQIYELCKGRICALKIASEIIEWFDFVSYFNNEINFLDFEKAKTIVKGDATVSLSPIITLSILDSANEMFNLGLKENVEYTLVGALAKNVDNFIKMPVAGVMALSSVPVYAVENLVNVSAKVLSLTIMKVNLALEKLDNYPLITLKKQWTVQVLKDIKNWSAGEFIDKETNETVKDEDIEKLKQMPMNELIKTGLLTHLSCKYRYRHYWKRDENGKDVIGLILGLSDLECKNNRNGTNYRVTSYGLGAGIFVTVDTGGGIAKENYGMIEILCLNPFGSIEGYYGYVRGGVGLLLGGVLSVAVGELGTKWILRAHTNVVVDSDAGQFGAGADVGGIIITKIN